MNTGLYRAAESGDLAEVQRILRDNPGIEVDAVNDYGNTPLVIAVSEGHKDIVEVLLAHGAAVNGPVGARRTPLQGACDSYRARSDIVSLLLEHGADVDATTARGRSTPLTLACRSAANFSSAQLLINAGADVNGGDGGIAPLHWAAYNGSSESLELLIQSGADVNRLSTEEWYDLLPAWCTPLHFAVRYDKLDCITQLLAAGADPNIANSAGQTALHHAALWSSIEIVNAFLHAGCDPLHQDNRGRAPLQHLYEERRNRHFSADHFKVITALVAAGDRSWECVPTPCPGLEATMLSVWQAAPDELPELMKLLENPPQNLIELYSRMDDDGEMKKVVQEVLRVLHHHFAGYPEVKEHLLKCIFGFVTV